MHCSFNTLDIMVLESDLKSNSVREPCKMFTLGKHPVTIGYLHTGQQVMKPGLIHFSCREEPIRLSYKSSSILLSCKPILYAKLNKLLSGIKYLSRSSLGRDIYQCLKHAQRRLPSSSSRLAKRLQNVYRQRRNTSKVYSKNSFDKTLHFKTSNQITEFLALSLYILSSS